MRNNTPFYVRPHSGEVAFFFAGEAFRERQLLLAAIKANMPELAHVHEMLVTAHNRAHELIEQVAMDAGLPSTEPSAEDVNCLIAKMVRAGTSLDEPPDEITPEWEAILRLYGLLLW